MFESEMSQRTAMMRPSLIRQVAEQGMGDDDIIALWFGEGCWPTSQIAVNALNAALGSGDHFYHVNSGKPSLRLALSDYQSALYQRTLAPHNITVTASAMQALALSAQALINPGDKVVYVDPVWPNLPEVFQLSGADMTPLSLTPSEGRWHLDMDRLIALLRPDVKAVMINTPNNPTGWVMSAEEQQILIAHCQKYGIWIIADEVYARLYHASKVAPSFQHLMSSEERLICVNSFSKAWSMTGWRLGWITAPRDLEMIFAQLTEYNIACPAGFVQEAGKAMLQNGEGEIAALQDRLAKAYQVVESRLSAIPNLSFVRPQGAFYALIAVHGYDDSVALATTLMKEAKVGLAPGAAFGSAAEGYLRLCYAQEEHRLHTAFDRLEAFLVPKKS